MHAPLHSAAGNGTEPQGTAPIGWRGHLGTQQLRGTSTRAALQRPASLCRFSGCLILEAVCSCRRLRSADAPPKHHPWHLVPGLDHRWLGSWQAVSCQMKGFGEADTLNVHEVMGCQGLASDRYLMPHPEALQRCSSLAWPECCPSGQAWDLELAVQLLEPELACCRQSMAWLTAQTSRMVQPCPREASGAQPAAQLCAWMPHRGHLLQPDWLWQAGGLLTGNSWLQGPVGGRAAISQELSRQESAVHAGCMYMFRRPAQQQ